MQTILTQLWLSDEPEIRREVAPVLNDEESTFIKKPKRGTGLWTSTWIEGSGSEWVEYEHEYCDLTQKYWYLLTPRQDSNLYIINNYADLEHLIQRYLWDTSLVKKMNEAYAQVDLGVYARRNPYFFAFDFEKISQDYDGVWLTDEGVGATRLPIFHEYDLYSWSCESILWFRWCFERVETIKPIAMVAEEIASNGID